MARRSPDWPAGILLIDKPPGWTSHDVVAKARGICRQRRIGHTGTLDPMATGLLVLCLGYATRLVEYMTRHDKSYEGEIVLGVSTDTDDADGTPIATAPVPPLNDDDLRDLAERFTGTIEQVPPAYSAVKVDGQRAYAVARKGEGVELSARSVRIHTLELTILARDRLGIRVDCGPGTYVRSLARDIGQVLGCGAHLAALRRTRVGAFHVREALTLDDLQQVAEAGRLAEVLRAADEGLSEFPAAILAPSTAHSIRNGVRVRFSPGLRNVRGPVRIYDTEGDFIATGEFGMSGELRPSKVMPGIVLMSGTDTNSD